MEMMCRQPFVPLLPPSRTIGEIMASPVQNLPTTFFPPSEQEQHQLEMIAEERADREREKVAFSTQVKTASHRVRWPAAGWRCLVAPPLGSGCFRLAVGRFSFGAAHSLRSHLEPVPRSIISWPPATNERCPRVTFKERVR